MKSSQHIRAMINRIARIDSAGSWARDVNPAQRAALEYLRDANRFSRSPSHVAEFLGTTRGTMSQTLKALMRKGYVDEQRSTTDKRSISFALTANGRALLQSDDLIAAAFHELDEPHRNLLEDTLCRSLRSVLRKNGGRAFGLCKTCKYHQAIDSGGFCQLLKTPLNAEEANQNCVEHEDMTE